MPRGNTDNDELDSDERKRLDAMTDAVKDLAVAASGGDAEGVEASLSEMSQLSKQVDFKAMRDIIHVPDDAGEYADDLKEILQRIPDGWGRWISCGPGWYPIIVDLHHKLLELVPNYKPHQIKEKLGGLRFYWYSGEEYTVDIPGDNAPKVPEKDASQEEKDTWEKEFIAHQDRLENYLQTEDGSRRQAELESRLDKAEELVQAAEEKSFKTCESCGSAGDMHVSKTSYPNYKTLCGGCAKTQKDFRGEIREYITSDEWKKWAEERKKSAGS